MIKLNQIKLRVDLQQPGSVDTTEIEKQLCRKAASLLQLPETEIQELRILRRSIDARKKPELYETYTITVRVNQEERILKMAERKKKTAQIMRDDTVEYHFPESEKHPEGLSPVIVGMGPAGLFCGYFLALHGYRPILLERGRDVDARTADVERFWQEGVLMPDSNVQFGEGGAGTFSDGKLNTLIKDRDGRGRAVLRTFVEFGADPSIQYDAKPHIGTDVLARVVKNMRQEIIRLGGEVRFESQVTDLLVEQGAVCGVVVNHAEKIPCSQLVLAIGHSARDTFAMLYDKGLPMEAKSFAVGLRVEHPQSMINVSQFGCEHPGRLGAAPYKVTSQTGSGRGVYSFCMCPGGYVVNASSEPGRLAVNGMSYSDRAGANANSAIIVSVTPKDYGSEHPLAGIAFQRTLEERAYRLAEGRIPIQRYGEFKERVLESGGDIEQRSTSLLQKDVEMDERSAHAGQRQENMDGKSADEEILPWCKGAYAWADVSTILPHECSEALVEGMESFGRQIKGFNRPDAILSGVESRTSSPVRILRDENLCAQIKGIYPCGEGAGYAGGITSAAMDGIRVAEAVANKP